MSLADKTWSAQFTTKQGDGEAKATNKPATGLNQDWQAKWDIWTQAALFLTKQANRDDLASMYGLETASTEQLALIWEPIAQLTNSAQDMFQAAKAALPKQPATDAELTKDIVAAIYGSAVFNKDKPNHANKFNCEGKYYATMCGATGTTDAKKSLAAVIYCVCGSAQGQGKKTRNKNHGQAAEFEASGSPRNGKWQHIRWLFPKLEQHTITIQRLAATLINLKGTIHVNGADAYVGPSCLTNCDGNANGACAKLTTRLVPVRSKAAV
ncbi:Trypanosomal VSG domain containing protein, putative [Trypanosoma equiperdum]|uniref:Trypanosomal VSG domain containing protein, putative n=1 Tax=Trypanosoma equiperdum TaxID=5694 RepID=A0A1G4IGI7_TRYEQ|nr:Trypanosomal VSG domain containing protein, putative [Trypanosoma equiperdum]